MFRLAGAVLATIAIVVFAISNFHHVDLSFGVGKPVEIRLIFLLLNSFIIGMAVPVFYRLIRCIDRDKLERREKELQRAIVRVDRDVAA